jgi:hypothetical protein
MVHGARGGVGEIETGAGDMHAFIDDENFGRAEVTVRLAVASVLRFTYIRRSAPRTTIAAGIDARPTSARP